MPHKYYQKKNQNFGSIKNKKTTKENRLDNKRKLYKKCRLVNILFTNYINIKSRKKERYQQKDLKKH
jgi:hypothetical protein